jgi:prophage regulatory protein
MPERLLRLSQVRNRVGLGRSRIYDLASKGQFPQPIKLGRSSAWVESEVDIWIAERIQQDRGQGASKGGES